MNDPKSIHRRKWLVGGVAIFGALIFASTGFAAYVIGHNVSSTKGDVNVSVETAKNSSYTLTASLSESSLVLGETELPSTSGFVTEDATKAPGDMTITFSSLKLVYGAAAAENLPTKIVFSWDYSAPKTGTNPNLANQVTLDSTGKHGTKPIAGYWEYVAAPSDLSFDKASANTSGGLSTIELTAKTITIPWGSYYGGKSPLSFYNEQYSAGGTTEDSDNVLSELNAMHTALDSKGLTLTISLKN